MQKNIKVMALATFIALLHVSSSSTSYAISSSTNYIDARILFMSALNLISQNILELSPFYDKQIGKISIGTNGEIIYGDGLYGKSKGTPQRLDIQSAEISTVDVYCTADATISNGRDRLDVNDIEFVFGESNQAPVGGGNSCEGLERSPRSQVMDSESNDTSVYIGVTVNGNNTTPLSQNAYFNTTNIGGSPPSIRVLYH